MKLRELKENLLINRNTHVEVFKRDTDCTSLFNGDFEDIPDAILDFNIWLLSPSNIKIGCLYIVVED